MKYLLSFICLFVISLPIFGQETIEVDVFGGINCEDYLARMDNVISQASNNPTAKIYVFVYEGKTKKYNYRRAGNYTIVSVFPQYGLAKAKINSMRKYVSIKGSSAESFTFVKAGFRENFTVEIWLVPAGAALPKPTPTIAKLKYRKGKPYGFCPGCCDV